MPPAKSPGEKPRRKAATPTAPPPDETAAPSSAETKPAPRKRAPKAAPDAEPAVPPERMVFETATYEANKDAIKAPLKDLGLKWAYLGPGKGIYRGEGVNVFVQFTDAGADFTLRGKDVAARERILREWRALVGGAGLATAAAKGEEAKAEEAKAEESEAQRLWMLAKPQRRPGEPEGFHKRRLAEWEAKRPS